MRGLVEVAKALAKGGLIGGCAVGYLLWVRDSVMALGLEPLRIAMTDTGAMIAMTLVVCSFGMLVVALADAPFQVWSHNRELRMTRQEIREELKETEGRPEVRSRIRSLQQQLANRRMLRDVPRADVVVTNPTHFAVALRYDDRRMRAPVVIAKGVDHMAARIRDLAVTNRVALFEAPLAGACTVLDYQHQPGNSRAALPCCGPGADLRVPRPRGGADRRSWPDKPAPQVEPGTGQAPSRQA